VQRRERDRLSLGIDQLPVEVGERSGRGRRASRPAAPSRTAATRRAPPARAS
jgi:hypothetical protein